MTVLNFSYAEILDEEKFREYISAAGVLMKKAGVEVVLRSEYASTLKGKNCNPHITAIFRYANESAAHDFLNSEDYKALIPLRDASCKMTTRLYRELG